MAKRRITPGLLPALVMIVVVLALVFYAGPLQTEVKAIKDQTTQLNVELTSSKQKLVELQTLQTNIPQDVPGQTRLLKSIPIELEEDKLLTDLYGLAQSKGIAFSSINFALTEDKAESQISKVRISASFFGNYSDLIAFLQGIEKSERKLYVKSINVQLQDGTTPGEPLKANFNLNMEAYYQGIVK